MVNEPKSDPIEGFHFTGYDPASGTLTIEIHSSALKHKPSVEALQIRAVRIMTEGGRVNEVTFIPRDTN
jgi:hypothetical protein